MSEAKITTWWKICGDCGSTSHKSKEAAEKAAIKHGKDEHAGNAVIKVRQR